MSEETAESEVIQDAPTAESSPAPEAVTEEVSAEASEPEAKKVNKVQPPSV